MQDLIAELRRLFEGSAEKARQQIAHSQERFGLDGEELLGRLELRVPGHSCRNMTDWNYDFCFSYDFLLEANVPMPHLSHKGYVDVIRTLNRPLFSMEVEVSAVLPLFTMSFCSRRIVKASSTLRMESQLQPFNEGQEKIRQAIEQELSLHGLDEIGWDSLILPVSNVTVMDMAKAEEVCVYTCLFHDRYGGRPTGPSSAFEEPLER